MFRKLFHPVLLLLLAGLFFTAKESRAQLTLTGPNCVVKGSSIGYYLDGFNYSVINHMDWCVTNGTIIYQESNCQSGDWVTSIPVEWSSTASTGAVTVTITTPNGTTNLSITVTLVDPLNPGSLQSAATQTIPYDTKPGTIFATAASGGACTPSYSYLWESTTDFITFTTVGTDQNYTPGNLTQTTYYRRTVTEGTTGAIGFLDSYAIIYVSPPLQGGTLSPVNQTISTGGIAYLCSNPSGGNGMYTYIWQSSTDGITFSPMEGAPNNSCYILPQFNTAGVYYYQLKTECRSTILETAYSTVATINVIQPLDPGTITPSTINILRGASPGQLTISPATGGTCSGVYTYSWESSTSPSFTNPSTLGSSQNYTPGAVSELTYFRRKVSCNGTDMFSNYVTVNVPPPLQGGTLSPVSQNISIGGFANLYGIPTGGNCAPNYIYTWQSSSDGITFSDMGGAPNSGMYLFPQFNTAGLYYYRQKIECRSTITETAYSTVATINVVGPLDPGTLSPSTYTILSGTSPGQLNGTPATGGTCYGVYDYTWESRTAATFTTPLIVGSSQNYTPVGVTELTYFRRKVSCNGTDMFTNYVTVNVYQPLNPGTIDGNTGPINYGTSPGAISNTESASGGNCSSYNYKWQKSTDEGASYNDIDEATAESFTPGPLYTTTIFRRKIKCDLGEEKYSNSITVTVLPQLNGGYVTAGSSTIPGGSVPAPISSSVAASGGNCGGSYTYMWEYSTGGGYYTTGVQTLSFSPGSLTQTTSFRRRVDCGTTETSYSNVIVITVVPALNAGTITGNTGPFAVNTSPGAINSTQSASGGICSTFVYQWQQSIDGGNNYTDINLATGLSYTPGLLATTTSFRRRAVCGTETAYSNALVVQINSVLPGTIVPEQLTIAPGTSAGMLTANAARGGSCNGDYHYHWESSPDGITWTPISGAGSQNYTPTVTQSTYYRRAVECNGITYFTNTAFISIGTLSSDQNYIRVRNLVKPGITIAEAADQLTNATDVQQTTSYFDGLGRLIQTVNKQITPLQKDMVVPVVYDQFGREAVKYLPYVSTAGDGNFKPNAIPEQNAFNATQFTGDQFYYGLTEFEASPLSRVVNSMAQGNSWTGASRGAGIQYQVNTEAENVRIWSVAAASGSVPVSSGAYPSGRLYKNVTADEHGKEVVEYKDKEGKVILKKVQSSDSRSIEHSGWLCTYYIYDDLNNLRFVLQPKAVELISSNWVITPSIAWQLCFQYEYDQRNRMVLKKVPGAGEVYMVYDARDRLVMTQDGNMRNSSPFKWMVTKYDVLNRPVETGIWDGGYSTFSVHLNEATNNFLNYPTGYPVTSNGYELLTKTHYDNYTDLPAGLSTFNSESANNAGFITNYNASPLYAQPLTPSTYLKNMVTWTKVKVLGSTNTFVSTVLVYDDRGRVIQTQSINHTGGLDIATTQYDFSGKPLRVHQKTQKLNNTAHSYELFTTMNYDHAGRIKSISKKLTNNGTAYPEKIIAEMAYDESGQLKTKKLAPGYKNNTGIETLVYDYNIRGWMLGMNRDYLQTEGQSGTTKFGFELGYDKPANQTGQNFSNSVQYNGNIAGMAWKSDGDDVRRMYSFGYDGANRLLKGDFVQQNPEDHSWNNNRINYSVQMGNGTDGRTAYDANGNILSMTQYGWKPGAGAAAPIDKLTYHYYDGSNRLKAVLDEVNDPMTKLGDFRTSGTHPFAAYKTPANTWVTDYNYDGNGNLTTDYNKDINPIAYNHLNLPSVVYTNKGTIIYTYDAAGNKLEKKVTEGTTLTITTYLGGAVYQSKGVTGAPGQDALQFIGMEEGRMRVDAGNTTTPNPYDYMVKDHLGNVRMVLTDEQKTDIYPVAHFEGDQSCARNIYDINTGKIFDKPDDSQLNYANNNGFNGSPCGDNAGTNTKMYKLFATSGGADVGLGMTLKVMAGDVINIFGNSYYNTANSSQTNYTTTVAQIVAGLLGVGGGGTAAVGKGATQPVLNANAGTLAANSFLTDPNRGSGTVPKAYINWVLFDEQFNYVTGGFSRVNESANSLKDHHSDFNNIPMTKSGYLYIYASNESPVAVFFDNLQVVHTRGPILEETHYYPFGLTMAGISSKAATTLETKIKFNGYEQQSKEFSDGSGLEWYDYKHRFYDNQIGRFFTQDGLAHEYVYYSPYQFAGNEVPNAIDLDGLEPARANGATLQQESKRKYQEAYDRNLQKPQPNTNEAGVSGTAVITKGDIGTAAFNITFMNLDFGFTSSNNEQDVVGYRDNVRMVDGGKVGTQTKQRTDGAGLGVGIIAVSDQEITETNTVTGKSQTSTVQSASIGPVKFDNSGNTSLTIMDAKVGFMGGAELGLQVNFGNASSSMMPPAMRDNRVDNATNRSGSAVPIIKTPPAATSRLLPPPPPQKTFIGFTPLF